MEPAPQQIGEAHRIGPIRLVQPRRKSRPCPPTIDADDRQTSTLHLVIEPGRQRPRLEADRGDIHAMLRHERRHRQRIRRHLAAHQPVPRPVHDHRLAQLLRHVERHILLHGYSPLIGTTAQAADAVMDHHRRE